MQTIKNLQAYDSPNPFDFFNDFFTLLFVATMGRCLDDSSSLKKTPSSHTVMIYTTIKTGINTAH